MKLKKLNGSQVQIRLLKAGQDSDFEADKSLSDIEAGQVVLKGDKATFVEVGDIVLVHKLGKTYRKEYVFYLDEEIIGVWDDSEVTDYYKQQIKEWENETVI